MRLIAWWRVSHRRICFQRWDVRAAEVDLHARLDRFCISGEWFYGTRGALEIVGTLRRHRQYPRPSGEALELPRFDTDKLRRAWLARIYQQAHREAA